MTWLLLFTLTALVVLLPMVPALLEWRWPSDVTPLFIDKDDALDPPFLARSFALNLATALALRHSHLGRSRITSLVPCKAWPFEDPERATATSHRVWDLLGDAELPAGMAFLAEVAARGALHAAPGGLYRALWARDALHLAAGCTVLRWAHGTCINVGPGCDLAGRISADETITLAPGTRFVLLHAPVLHFGSAQHGLATAPGVGPPAAVTTTATTTAPAPESNPGLPEAVVWHAATARGRCDTPLHIEAGCTWSGDLVCTADLHLGAGCRVQGSLKAHGRLTLGVGCTVSGSVVAQGAVTLAPGCTVGGSVVSETAITLGDVCTVGVRGIHCTVAAPRITVGVGVVAHGTVWAGEQGLCSAADAVLPAAPTSLVVAANADKSLTTPASLPTQAATA